MTFIIAVIASLAIAAGVVVGARKIMSIVGERNRLRERVAVLSLSEVDLAKKNEILDEKLNNAESEITRLRTRILAWEKYNEVVEPRMVNAEEKVEVLTVLTEDSSAEIAILRARVNTLFAMLDRYADAKLSAEILQSLINLMKKAEPKAAC